MLKLLFWSKKDNSFVPYLREDTTNVLGVQLVISLWCFYSLIFWIINSTWILITRVQLKGVPLYLRITSEADSCKWGYDNSVVIGWRTEMLV